MLHENILIIFLCTPSDLNPKRMPGCLVIIVMNLSNIALWGPCSRAQRVLQSIVLQSIVLVNPPILFANASTL